MYCITEQQVDYILNDIRRNGIDTEDLQLNLLDHICCMAEHSLKEGDDFELFYHTAIRQFYKNELREIEEETTRLLTFKNYFMLKKIMFTSGAISVMAFLAGSFFKVMHWPGAAVLLTFGIFFLSFLFLPVVFILKAKEVNSGLQKFTIGVGTLLGILFCLDILFTVQHWPGASMLWFSTVGLSLFVFIPLYFFTGYRKPETRTNTVLTTIILVGFTGLMFTAISLRPSPHQYENSLNVYLQNEEILKNMQRSDLLRAADQDTDLKLIFRLSEELKGAVLKDATGQSAVPRNADALHLPFRQHSLAYMDGYFERQGPGQSLFAQLQLALAAYTKRNDAIPEALSLVRETPDRLQKYDNLYLLNSLAQLQIYLATSAAGTAQQAVAQR